MSHRSARRESAPPILRVDPIACDGIGMCAHVAPSLIELDRWGYPILLEAAPGSNKRNQVAAAIAACPRRALFSEVAK